MQEATFKHGEAVGLIRTLTDKREQVDLAFYLSALSKYYPELRGSFVDVSQISAAGFLIFSQANDFGQLARHVVELHGLGFDFPRPPSATPELVKQAFDHFLDDEGGLWDALKEEIVRLKRPNSVAGAPPETLTPEEKKTS